MNSYPAGSWYAVQQDLGLIVPLDPAVERAYNPPELPSLEPFAEVILDTETTGLRWWSGDRPIGIAVGAVGLKPSYLPFGHRPGGNIDEALVRRWAKRELRGKRIIGHNIKFDLHMMREWGVDLEAQGCTVGDTMHYAALLDDTRRRGFDLDTLASEYLDERKIGGLDMKRLADYHAAHVAPYAEQDVKLTGGLLQLLDQLMNGQDLYHVRSLEDQTIFPTVEMERNAAPLDVPKLQLWLHDSEQALLSTLTEIEKEVGFAVGPESRDDLVMLFARRSLDNPYVTETGLPSFTDEVLAKYEDDRAISMVRRARRYASLRSKYLLKYWHALCGEAGEPTSDLLRFALHQLRADEGGTISGRYSSSAPDGSGTGANIQQVASIGKQRVAWGYEDEDASHDAEIFPIRELFVPRSGLFLAADAAQIEYRLFAHFANNPELTEAYRKDPKINFHKYIFNNMIIKYAPKTPYKHVKNTNFAKLYGAGARKIALMLGISVAEARALIAIYATNFPDMDRLLHLASSTALERGFVRTLTGRRSRFPSHERTHKALNNVIQGSAADIMKQKLIELHAERKNTGFVMRMTVHDEVCGDVPDLESARKVETILQRQSFDLRVPILWEVSTGANWKECA